MRRGCPSPTVCPWNSLCSARDVVAHPTVLHAIRLTTPTHMAATMCQVTAIRLPARPERALDSAAQLHPAHAPPSEMEMETATMNLHPYLEALSLVRRSVECLSSSSSSW